jgi:hypothetical protein
MAAEAEASFAKHYRDARRTFIEACGRAQADSIARVHPEALAPDGKPLFIDSTAFGSREAQKALLVITGRDGRDGFMGSQFLTRLLNAHVIPRAAGRMILVHALNPFGFAWNRRENEAGLGLDDPAAAQSWSLEMLGAIVTEDLAKCRKLRLLDVGKSRYSRATDASDHALARAVAGFKPGIDLRAARLELQPALVETAGIRVTAKALATL